MVEVLLAILLSIASAFGVFFWRKGSQLEKAAKLEVDTLREQARQEVELREEAIEANIQDINDRIKKAGDDRHELARLLNSDD